MYEVFGFTRLDVDASLIVKLHLRSVPTGNGKLLAVEICSAESRAAIHSNVN